ncbi:MAG: tetratricopeptide repeat protein [Gemmataceae bacterium]|nr:tetratricopeptide repeat protein [Gemmataceae bacterium]MCI0742507.1 tetratricopeptide repeat protein [Gemmataceae bacterium]
MLRYVKVAVRALTYPLRAARRRPLVALLLIAALLATLLVCSFLYAGYQWRSAQNALASDRAEEARAHLAFCLFMWPRSAEVQFIAGRAARLCGDVTAAEAHLDRCLKLEGATQKVQLEFLLLRVQTGEVDQVASALVAAVEEGHPESPLILETLARAYMHLLRYKEALACLTRWIEEMQAPESAKPHQWRGWVFERLGHSKRAMEDYQKALRHDPSLSSARLRVAEMLLEDNDPLAAIPHLEHLREQLPTRPEPMARLGQCRFLQGRHDEARRLLEEAVKEMPKDLNLLVYLGKLELQQDRPADAEKWLRRALQVDDKDTEALYTLVSVLQVRGRVEEAAATLKQYKHFKELVERVNRLLREESDPATNNPAVCSEIGILLLQVGRERLGEYWLGRALEGDPHHQPSHKALADYYDGKGESDKAAHHRARLRLKKE